MRAQLYSVQGLSTGRLSTMARPRGGDWLLDEIKAIRAAGVDVLVSLLTPDEVKELDLAEEAEFCRLQDVMYLSFPIQDLSIPPFSAFTFAFLAQLKAYLLEGKYLVLHCRQGIGRSSLMAASVLVLLGSSPEQAFELLSLARGCPVPETQEQKAWAVAFAREYRAK